MAPPVALRSDFTATDLRRHARRSRDAGQARRLLALAAIHDGGSRSDAARIGGVGFQIVRDWVLKFNASGPAGLVGGTSTGRSRRLSDAQCQALEAIVQAGPDPAVHGIVRWRLADMVQWLWQECGVSVSETTVSRELHALGYRKLTARPRHHAQDPEALNSFKKSSPPRWLRSRRVPPPASA